MLVCVNTGAPAGRRYAILRLLMSSRIPVLIGLLLLCGCQKSDVKVLIGATAVVAPGAQPIEDSVIVIAGQTVRSVGMRKDIPIPQDSERTDLTGKWVAPRPGARIAIGEPANIQVLEHQGDTRPSRVLEAGKWTQSDR